MPDFKYLCGKIQNYACKGTFFINIICISNRDVCSGTIRRKQIGRNLKCPISNVK